MAADAIHWGADALLVFPPAIFKGLPPGERDEAIVSYHCKLSRFGCPLVLFYLYDEAGGVSYSAEVLRELLALPRTLGIKVATLDSVMTLQDVSTLISSEFPEKLLITGEDRMFGYSLMRGARSALVGLGAAFPGIQRDLMRASQRVISKPFWRYPRGLTPMPNVRLSGRWTNTFCGCCGAWRYPASFRRKPRMISPVTI
ncbi:hypothetical protein HMSSN036_50970 [Paenibacillus macerans]|nr:hypothetical protein HMSSN036_50970 [Paenibacillus macerans]